MSWGFYGRGQELSRLQEILRRDRWFFAKMTGRRRIGKTTLIQQALQAVGTGRVFYVQIPDSAAAGVLSEVADRLDTFAISEEVCPRPGSLSELAKSVGRMAERGYVVVLDEFQYFNRAVLQPFCSHLQAEVDRLTNSRSKIPGGLIVLGSIHTEMAALLEDRTSPLYNRVTDVFDLTHLDIASILEILRAHADDSPERLLFLWTLFEGVPKFYRDCFEQGVLGKDRRTLLRRIYFESSSPLRTEADNWFLRELHGRYDVVLKTVARSAGCMHNELVEGIRRVSRDSTDQIGGYLKVLTERYRLIEKKLPVFAGPKAKKSRYYLTDNFLRTWLAAIASPVRAVAFRPVEELVTEADTRLNEVEGNGLEKLVGVLYEERSRKAVGDFPLTARVQGYWDRSDTEIDLVAIRESDQTIRFGSCKRSADRLIADIEIFDGHVSRFLETFPKYNKWTVEKVSIAPTIPDEIRNRLQTAGRIPQDLRDLTRGL